MTSQCCIRIDVKGGVSPDHAVSCIFAGNARASRMAASDLLDLETNAKKYVGDIKECSMSIRAISKKLSGAESLVAEACAAARQLKENVSTFVMPPHEAPTDLQKARERAQKKIEIAGKVSRAHIENSECILFYARYADTIKANVNGNIERCQSDLLEVNGRCKKRNIAFDRDSEIVSNVGVDLFERLPDEMVIFILSMVGHPCVQIVCKRFLKLYAAGEKRRSVHRYMQTKPLAYRIAMPQYFRVCPSTKTQTRLVSGSGIEFVVDRISLTVGDFTYTSPISRIYVGQSLVLCDVERHKVVLDLKNRQPFDWAKVQLHLMNDLDPCFYEALDLDTDNIVFWRRNQFVVCASTGEVILKSEKIDYDRPYHVDVGFGRIVAAFVKRVSWGSVTVHAIFCAKTGKKLVEKETTYGLAYNCSFGVVIEAFIERWFIIGQKMWKGSKADMNVCCIDRAGNMVVSKDGEATFCYKDTKVYMVY